MRHLEKIAEKLTAMQVDALLINSIPTERYAMGFRGKGFVLVAPGFVQYSVDGRYIEAAKRKFPDICVRLADKEHSHMDWLRKALSERKIGKLGIEDAYMTLPQFRSFEKQLSCELLPCSGFLEELRLSKDEEEIDAIRRAQKYTDESFTEILNFIRPGVTESEIAAKLVYEMFRRGGQRLAFNPIIAAGANGDSPHAVFGPNPVENGMFVTMDFGCIVDGYCSDITRTVAVGQPTEEMQKVYDTVLRAQKRAISVARAGIRCDEFDAAARDIIADAGYGAYFGHNLGHSIGIENHEVPSAAPGCRRILPAGTVISAEPGIYLPGRFGVRIEDLVVLRENGCENLTKSPKELIIL